MREKKTGLEILREPFQADQISKLPKPTAAQTKAVRDDFKAGVRCDVCGTWHHPKVVHLDYVGHAALTNRLLDCDENWNWEPVSVDQKGHPNLDADGGMWIKLTVCGVTRLGYGDAQDKTGSNATKERIGDALRNAAMRFGAALDLWHKGEYPLFCDGDVTPPARQTVQDDSGHDAKPKYWSDADFESAIKKQGKLVSGGAKTSSDLLAWMQTKAALTDDQKAAVLALNKDDPAVDGEFIAAG